MYAEGEELELPLRIAEREGGEREEECEREDRESEGCEVERSLLRTSSLNSSWAADILLEFVVGRTSAGAWVFVRVML